MKKILLPKNKQKRDYIIYLYKNKNNFHNMNEKDINNLIKLISFGKLEEIDYPKLKKEEKLENKLNGYSFSFDFFSKI